MIQKHKILAQDLDCFLSEYLMGGYRQDQSSLTHIEIESGKIEGFINIEDYFRPSDGQFHFTVPLSLLWVSQLAIIYACLDNHLSSKQGESYLNKWNIVCKKPILQTHQINIKILLMSKRKFKNNFVYKGNFDICNKSFYGQASFIFPVL